MAKPANTWTEKFERACQGTPKVVKIEGKLAKRWGAKTCVIPSPREVEGLMRQVPKGKVTTINEMRGVLAHKHRAAMACPITTGIFSWIAAYRAEEDRSQGKGKIAPYWRALKLKGEVNPKYPGGIAVQKMFLEGEGHKVVARGKKAYVVDYEAKLARLK